MKCWLAGFAVLAVFFDRGWSSCEQDGSCDTVDTTSSVLLQSKRKSTKLQAEVNLWPQYGEDNRKCENVDCEATGQCSTAASQDECQALVGDASYYSYRGDNGACIVSVDCSNPVTTGAPWRMYAAPAPTPSPTEALTAAPTATPTVPKKKAPPSAPTAATTAACDWVQYLGDNTKCATMDNGASGGGFAVADQAACQTAAEDAGHQFYQFTTELSDGYCSTTENCDSPTTGTTKNWKVFQCQGAAPAAEQTAAPTAAPTATPTVPKKKAPAATTAAATEPVCDENEGGKMDIQLSHFSPWGKGTKLKFYGKSPTTDVGYDIIAMASPRGTFTPNNGKLTDGGLASINFPQRQKSSVIFKFFEPGSTVEASPEGFSLSLYDLDSNEYGSEIVTVFGAQSYAAGVGYEQFYTVDESGTAVTLTSTQKAGKGDNPQHTGSLTADQIAKSITFKFGTVSSFELDVDLTGMDNTGGRNVLFSFIDEVEHCIEAETTTSSVLPQSKRKSTKLGGPPPAIEEPLGGPPPASEEPLSGPPPGEMPLKSH